VAARVDEYRIFNQSKDWSRYRPPETKYIAENKLIFNNLKN
jgi:hypothetical protein